MKQSPSFTTGSPGKTATTTAALGVDLWRLFIVALEYAAAGAGALIFFMLVTGCIVHLAVLGAQMYYDIPWLAAVVVVGVSPLLFGLWVMDVSDWIVASVVVPLGIAFNNGVAVLVC